MVVVYAIQCLSHAVIHGVLPLNGRVCVAPIHDPNPDADALAGLSLHHPSQTVDVPKSIHILCFGRCWLVRVVVAPLLPRSMIILIVFVAFVVLVLSILLILLGVRLPYERTVLGLLVGHVLQLSNPRVQQPHTVHHQFADLMRDVSIDDLGPLARTPPLVVRRHNSTMPFLMKPPL